MHAGNAAGDMGGTRIIPFPAAAGIGPKLARDGSPPPDVGVLYRQLPEAGGVEPGVSHSPHEHCV